MLNDSQWMDVPAIVWAAERFPTTLRAREVKPSCALLFHWSHYLLDSGTGSHQEHVSSLWTPGGFAAHVFAV
jgi:hypothetical protein